MKSILTMSFVFGLGLLAQVSEPVKPVVAPAKATSVEAPAKTGPTAEQRLAAEKLRRMFYQGLQQREELDKQVQAYASAFNNALTTLKATCPDKQELNQDSLACEVGSKADPVKK